MKLFGDRLKEAREERGVSLDAITRETRIPRRYLLALERSDLDTLPGGAFDKGYIKSYARCIDLDPGPFLEAYSERERQLGRGSAESERETLAELHRLVQRRAGPKRASGAWKWGLATTTLLALALAAGTWLVARDEAPPPRPASARDVPTRRSPQALLASTPRPQATEPEPQEQPPSLSVQSFGVGTAVVEHRLEGRSDRFPAGTEVFFWTRVVGGESGQRLRHIWRSNGRIAMASDLPIGGPHWRTYSRLQLPPGGAGETWSVEARTADGRLLARQEFSVVE